MRLLGFERVELKPGESKIEAVKVDLRLLARFDGKTVSTSGASPRARIA
jgi:hypothetical protein